MLGSPASRLHVTALIHRGAQQYPDNVFTIDAATQRQRSYRETAERVARLAAALRAQGLSKGGRVALVALNSDRYLEVMFACAWAGGLVVPLNIRLAVPEMVEQLVDCAAEVLIVDDAFKGVAEGVRGRVPSVRTVVFCGEGAAPAGSLRYEALLAQHAPCEDAQRGGDDVFGLFYTGGTTGKPKGVMLTHGNIFVNALGHVAMLQYSASSRYLHSAPMFHLADMASTFGVTMAGGSHVFIPRFVPEELLRAVQQFRVNKAMMVPSMIAMLLQTPNQEQYDCSSLENLIYGASPMPEALLAPAMAKFPRCKFTQGYGMTETSPAICMLPPEAHTPGNKHLRSVGRPVPWAEVRIVDKNNQPVPRGTVGEIVTRGPHVMKGYWNMPDKTAETVDAQGWMHTEDGGYMDAEGYVFIVDRIKDMIITGGENVYATEVENAVAKFPGVAMCAVIGLPDKKFVEIVAAFVVPQPGAKLDEAAVIKHCRDHIANYKVPRKVFLRKELPMSGAGKILKNKLREEFKTDALGNAKL